MKRALTIGELFTILSVLALPAVGWGLTFSMKVQANSTNIENMQKTNIELLEVAKNQNNILTDIKVELATKQKVSGL